MSNESAERSLAILAAAIATFAGRNIRQCDALTAFRELAEHVPGLEPGELAGAADEAKQLASDLRSLGHRAWQLQIEERRRARTAAK